MASKNQKIFIEKLARAIFSRALEYTRGEKVFWRVSELSGLLEDPIGNNKEIHASDKDIIQALTLLIRQKYAELNFDGEDLGIKFCL